MPGQGNPFSLEERKKIVQLIMEQNAYSRVKGESVWREIESEFERHTWQSLKHHFKTHIFPNLHHSYYELTTEEIQNFREGWISSGKKMSHMINAFFATEITCIPQVLDKYAGKYYSNTITNGATWVFFMWHILHFVFEEFINLLLKKMKIKEYIRVRLKHSIWYLGFYITSFCYCTATLLKNNIDAFSSKKLLDTESDIVPGHLILGFIVLCTFYTHSIIWEGLMKGFSISSVSYLFLTSFILLTYFCRKVEISLSLLAIISLTQFGIELARCILTLLKHDSQLSQLLGKIILGGAICLFVLTHFIIIPLFFLLPLGYSFIVESKSTSLILLNVTIWSWLFCELLNNPLYKFIKHWMNHNFHTPKTQCAGTAVECSLFQPRDDVAFNLKIVRQEIKEREAKMMSLRKPKNRNMLLQTLKCMVAIKKKLKEKRSSTSESSDSEDSETDPCTPEICPNVKKSDSDEEISELDDERATLLAQNDKTEEITVEVQHENGRDKKKCE